jgi:ribonuclease E
MTRKRVGQGLLEVFSEPCEHCRGRGVIVSTDPVDERRRSGGSGSGGGSGTGSGNGGGSGRRDRPGGAKDKDTKDDAATEQAVPAEPVANGESIADAEPAEGTRSGSRRNRGRRGRGQSGEDRAAEDAAVLAGGQTDVEPDTEALGTTDPAVEAAVEAVIEAVVESQEEPSSDGAAEQPASATVEVVPALPETLPQLDGDEPVEAPALEAEAPTAAARPRRRRAASRPAGPPV